MSSSRGQLRHLRQTSVRRCRAWTHQRSPPHNVATFLGVTLVTALGAMVAPAVGPATLAVASIGSLVAALGAFAYVKWDQITTFVRDLGAKIGEGIMSILRMVMGAISAMAASIANAIKGAFSFGGAAGKPGGSGE